MHLIVQRGSFPPGAENLRHQVPNPSVPPAVGTCRRNPAGPSRWLTAPRRESECLAKNWSHRFRPLPADLLQLDQMFARRRCFFQPSIRKVNGTHPFPRQPPAALPAPPENKYPTRQQPVIPVGSILNRNSTYPGPKCNCFWLLFSEETPAGSSSGQPLAGIRSETFHRIVGNG